MTTPLRRRAALLKEIEAVLLPEMRIPVWNHVGGACYGACNCGRPVVVTPEQDESSRWMVCGRSYRDWAGQEVCIVHKQYPLPCPYTVTGPTPPPEAATTEERSFMPETLERLRQDVPKAFLEVVAYCTSGVEPPSDEHNLFLWDGDYGDIWRVAVESVTPPAPAAEARPEQTEEERCYFLLRDGPCGTFRRHHLGRFTHPFTPGQRAGKGEK